MPLSQLVVAVFILGVVSVLIMLEAHRASSRLVFMGIIVHSDISTLGFQIFERRVTMYWV